MRSGPHWMRIAKVVPPPAVHSATPGSGLRQPGTENAKRRTLCVPVPSNQCRYRKFDMPNWAANDIFSQTRKLAIVTVRSADLVTRQLSRWRSAAMKLFFRSSIVPPTSLFADRFGVLRDGFYFQRSLHIGNRGIRAHTRAGL